MSLCLAATAMAQKADVQASTTKAVLASPSLKANKSLTLPSGTTYVFPGWMSDTSKIGAVWVKIATTGSERDSLMLYDHLSGTSKSVGAVPNTSNFMEISGSGFQYVSKHTGFSGYFFADGPVASLHPQRLYLSALKIQIANTNVGSYPDSLSGKGHLAVGPDGDVFRDIKDYAGLADDNNFTEVNKFIHSDDTLTVDGSHLSAGYDDLFKLSGGNANYSWVQDYSYNQQHYTVTDKATHLSVANLLYDRDGFNMQSKSSSGSDYSFLIHSNFLSFSSSVGNFQVDNYFNWGNAAGTFISAGDSYFQYRNGAGTNGFNLSSNRISDINGVNYLKANDVPANATNAVNWNGQAGDLSVINTGATTYYAGLNDTTGRWEAFPTAAFAPATGSTAYLSKTGGTMTGDLLLGSATPTDPLSAVPKIMLDNALTGITWKNAVRAKSTGNVTLSGLQTIDGVASLADGRYLLNSQTDPKQNGIWLMKSGAWVRPTDADSGDELWTSTVAVTLGTVNKNTQWTCLNTTGPTIGTDNITYGQISGAGTYAGSAGVTLTGNLFSADLSYLNGYYPQLSSSYANPAWISSLAQSKITYTGTTSQYVKGDGSFGTATISGVSLGSNLTDLTANDATITFSGSYNGSTARNIKVDTVTNIASKTFLQNYSYTKAQTLSNTERPLTFGSGLTRSTNTITNNLLTGVSGGQTVVGGTASGDNLTLSSTTNGTKGKILFGTSAYDEVNNRLGLLTTAPTHTLTLGSTATGAAFYNTTDQTTNYERVRQYWTGNIFNLFSESSGTGTIRSMQIGTLGNYILINQSGSVGTEIVRTNTGIGIVAGINTTLTSSSAVQSVLALYPTINQTGTGGYRGFFMSAYETSVGSGLKYLIDVGTNTAAAASGTHTSKFNVDNSGNLTAIGRGIFSQLRLSALNTAPSSSTDTGTAGEIRITSNYIYFATATNTWVRTALSTF